MPQRTYSCTITETKGPSWPEPGTSTKKYEYKGRVNMDGYKDSMVDSTRVWSCKEK